MAVNLIDVQKASKDPLEKGFITDMLRDSDLIGLVPWDDVDGLQVTGNRWQTIPGTAYRKIGGSYTESTGATEEIAETLVAMGGDVKIDRLLLKVKNTKQDPLQTQMQMKAKSIAFTFNWSFINGDQAVNPDEFEGMKKRISNMPARQTIDLYGIDAGDGYPVLKDTAHHHVFLDKLHEALKVVGDASAILCNEKAYLGLGQVLRRLGLLETTTDAYGRKWQSFQGVPLVDVGLKSDKTTEIITSTEDPGDGGNDTTSLYVVRFGTDDALHAIQLSGTSAKPYDPLAGAESGTGPFYLRRIDWAVGLFNLSQYCMARIKGLRFTAA